jgi:endonuclease-8
VPEGDTLHKLAEAMRPRLEAQGVRRLCLRGSPDEAPEALNAEQVYAHGKHLFVEFSDGRTLRCHLGMYGDWHRYPPGAAWKRPARQASVVIETGEHVFVCFNAKEAEWLNTDGVRRRVLASRLGPDLLAPELDESELLRRARGIADPDTALCDLLLDQRVASGIGNVYKSELLFLHRLHPLCGTGTVGDPALLALYRTARTLLQRNLGGGRRVTRFANDGRGSIWVYGRRAQPCLECGGPVEGSATGRHLRPTFWCPACQRR